MRGVPVLVLSAIMSIAATGSLRAAFHIVRFSEVMGQVKGDTRIQFVELLMLDVGQNFVQGHVITFQDETGRETGRVTFPDNVTGGAIGDTILIGTQRFADLFGVQVDLVLPEGIMSPFSGRVCFDAPDCVAYGAFTGSNAGYGSPAPRFPVSGALSLTLTAPPDPFPASKNNSRDFEFRIPTPRNNDDDTGRLPAPFNACFIEEDFADMSRWDQPADGAGADLANCGGPVVDLGFAEVNAGRLELRPSQTPFPVLNFPLCFTGMTNAAATGIQDPNHRLRFNVLAQPGIVIAAAFVREHYRFDPAALTIDPFEGGGFGINFSFDNISERTSDHLHPDVRGPCISEGSAVGPDEVKTGFLLKSATEYTVVMDVDGDEDSGPLTLQVKFFRAEQEEPIDYLGAWQLPTGLGLSPDPDLEHGPTIAAIGQPTSALEISQLTICPIPRNQQRVRFLTCERQQDRSVLVAWQNPSDAEDEPITIAVNGAVEDTIDGDSLEHVILDPPSGNLEISVTNYSGMPAKCSVCGNRPPEVLISGPASVRLVDGSATATLDSSASNDGDPQETQVLTRSWELLSSPAGSQAGLGPPGAAVVNLTTGTAGNYLVRLTITDDGCGGGLPESRFADHALRVDPATPTVNQRQGDCEQNGRINVTDAICLLGHLFLGTVPVLPCGDGTSTHPANRTLLNTNGDTTTGGDPRVDLSDAVYLLSFLFGGGEPPVLGRDCVAIEGCPEMCAAP